MLAEAEHGSGGVWATRTGNWCQRYDRPSQIFPSLSALFQDEGQVRKDLAAYAGSPPAGPSAP
jgi:hypothetical protein